MAADSTTGCDVYPGLLRSAAAMLALFLVGLFLAGIGVHALTLPSVVLSLSQDGWAAIWHAISRVALDRMSRGEPERLLHLLLAAPVWLSILVVLFRMLTTFRVDESGIHAPVCPAWWTRITGRNTIRWTDRAELATRIPWIACTFRLTGDQLRSSARRSDGKPMLLPALWLLSETTDLLEVIDRYAPPEHPLRRYYGIHLSSATPSVIAHCSEKSKEQLP